jgi:PTS system mannose-specific IID component
VTTPAFSRATAARVLLRSLLVQGSWNYETLIGTGFAFTVLPALRQLHPDDPDELRAAVSRHAEVFNSHPYLATVAVGAVARLERDGTDPRVVSRFKSALRGSLGSLGDQLVWGAWRPATLVLALLLLLAGAPWWVGVGTFLLLYNALTLALRVWGWRIGTANGMEVGRAIREVPLQPLAQRLAGLGAALAGAATVVAVAPLTSILPLGAAPLDPLGLAADATAVGMGLWFGVRMRRVMGTVVAVAWGLVIGLGMIG